MAPVISYLLKMLLCSGILYAYYHIALRNNRFHQWNRYYLLLATLLSLALPLLQLPLPFPEKQGPAFMAYTTQLITLREFILTGTPGSTVNYLQIVFYGYGLVALLLLGRIVYGCWKIRQLISRNPVQHLAPYYFVQSEQVKAPFSFFRYIFWSSDINPNSTDGQQILQHELAHVTEKHSADKLLMELVCAVGWINPFFHLLKKELAIVHEFIADQQAAAGHIADYAQTILQATLQSKQLSITNNFFHPPIKRRINMLFTQKSKFTIMKKLIVFPIIASLIIFIGCQQKNEATPDTIDITAKDVNKQSGNAPSPGTAIFTSVENPPTFPGGEAALAGYLGKNIRYPKAAQEKNISGTIFVQFVVQADGTISDVKTVGKTIGGGLEEEALRVVEAMPKWTPGNHQGKQVAVQFNLPIRYALDKLALLRPFLMFKKKGDC